MNVKFKLLFSGIFISYNCFSQVGIGTSTPKTTLEIIGQPNDKSIPDGVKFPNLKSSDLINNSLYSSIPNTTGKYNPNSKGTAVYIYEIDTTSDDPLFKEIKSPGTYYYNGNTWQINSSNVNYDIIEYASENDQMLTSFSLDNQPQIITFTDSDKVISNGEITLSNDGEYFTILEDGMYQVYGYVGVFPNKTLSENDFSEATAFIEFKRDNVATIISEGSDTFIGKMANLVNMVIVPSSLVILKGGDKIYFKVDFENITINGTSNSGYDNNIFNITNKVDNNFTLQKYTKYITIRRI